MATRFEERGTLPVNERVKLLEFDADRTEARQRRFIGVLTGAVVSFLTSAVLLGLQISISHGAR